MSYVSYQHIFPTCSPCSVLFSSYSFLLIFCFIYLNLASCLFVVLFHLHSSVGWAASCLIFSSHLTSIMLIICALRVLFCLSIVGSLCISSSRLASVICGFMPEFFRISCLQLLLVIKVIFQFY